MRGVPHAHRGVAVVSAALGRRRGRRGRGRQPDDEPAHWHRCAAAQLACAAWEPDFFSSFMQRHAARQPARQARKVLNTSHDSTTCLMQQPLELGNGSAPRPSDMRPAAQIAQPLPVMQNANRHCMALTGRGAGRQQTCGCAWRRQTRGCGGRCGARRLGVRATCGARARVPAAALLLCNQRLSQQIDDLVVDRLQSRPRTLAALASCHVIFDIFTKRGWASRPERAMHASAGQHGVIRRCACHVAAHSCSTGKHVASSTALTPAVPCACDPSVLMQHHQGALSSACTLHVCICKET